MSYEDKLIIGITLPIAFLLIAGIVLWIWLYERKYHPKKKINYEDIETPTPQFFQAKALKKRIHVRYEGYVKMPKSIMEYFILFELENGEQEEFMLSQETFEKIEEGQEGTFVLLNGLFFDFGDGEMIEETVE